MGWSDDRPIIPLLSDFIQKTVLRSISKFHNQCHPNNKGKVSLALLLWVENQPLVSTFGTRTRNLPPAAIACHNGIKNFMKLHLFFLTLCRSPGRSRNLGEGTSSASIISLWSQPLRHTLAICCRLSSQANIGSKPLWSLIQYFGPPWFYEILLKAK